VCNDGVTVDKDEKELREVTGKKREGDASTKGIAHACSKKLNAATTESTNGVIGESATSTCKKIGAAVCNKRRIAGQEQLVARNDEMCKKKRKDTDKGTTKKLPAKYSMMTREFTQVFKIPG